MARDRPDVVHPKEPRRIEGMQGSPPERAHHDPKSHAHDARPILPAARDLDAAHKEPVRHEHDAYWRKKKSG